LRCRKRVDRERGEWGVKRNGSAVEGRSKLDALRKEELGKGVDGQRKKDTTGGKGHRGGKNDSNMEDRGGGGYRLSAGTGDVEGYYT